MYAIEDDKEVVKDYFISNGLRSLAAEFMATVKLTKSQLDIRTGHQQTVDTLLGWLQDDGNLAGITVCDAGCGVGSLSIPSLKQGAIVSASDISEKMVEEGKERAAQIFGNNNNPNFTVQQDLESLGGKYHTVVCLDVLDSLPPRQSR